MQTAFTRNLPFFFLKQVDVPIEQHVPTMRTSDILTTDATGSIGGEIMDHDFRVEYTQTWSGGVQAEILSSTVFEAFYMGSYTVGADNSTIRNVPRLDQVRLGRGAACRSSRGYARSGSTVDPPTTP